MRLADATLLLCRSHRRSLATSAYRTAVLALSNSIDRRDRAASGMLFIRMQQRPPSSRRAVSHTHTCLRSIRHTLNQPLLASLTPRPALIQPRYMPSSTPPDLDCHVPIGTTFPHSAPSILVLPPPTTTIVRHSYCTCHVKWYIHFIYCESLVHVVFSASQCRPLPGGARLQIRFGAGPLVLAIRLGSLLISHSPSRITASMPKVVDKGISFRLSHGFECHKVMLPVTYRAISLRECRIDYRALPSALNRNSI